MIGYAFLLTILVTQAEGSLIVTADKATVSVGDTVVLSCTADTALTSNIVWETTRYAGAQSLCFYDRDSCIPSTSSSDSRYTFSSDVANRQFYMTIANAEEADFQTYTCRNIDDSVTITISVTGLTTMTGYRKDYR